MTTTVEGRAFRERGKDITRLEGFSDCSFGFAITLLVLSLEVPSSFTALLHLMAGIPTFAISFALLAYIWYTQYRFYRRYGLEDLATVVLNMALLFVVLVYVYPLKFIFGVALGSIPTTLTLGQSRGMYLLYGGGEAAVFLILGLLYANALRLAAQLQLSPAERVVTRFALLEQLLTGLVGLLSAGLALVLPESLVVVPGVFYFVIAPIRTVTGFRQRRAIKRVSTAPS